MLPSAWESLLQRKKTIIFKTWDVQLFCEQRAKLQLRLPRKRTWFHVLNGAFLFSVPLVTNYKRRRKTQRCKKNTLNFFFDQRHNEAVLIFINWLRYICQRPTRELLVRLSIMVVAHHQALNTVAAAAAEKVEKYCQSLLNWLRYYQSVQLVK